MSASVAVAKCAAAPALAFAGLPVGVPATPFTGSGLLAIFGLNASGFLSSVDSIASLRADSCAGLFMQPWQLQFWHMNPDAKHSQ